MIPLDYLDSRSMGGKWCVKRHAPDAIMYDEDARKKYSWLKKSADKLVSHWTKNDVLFAGKLRQFFVVDRVEDSHAQMGLTTLHTPTVMALMSFGNEEKAARGSRPYYEVWDVNGKSHGAHKFFGAGDMSVCPISGCRALGQSGSDWVSAHLRDHYGQALFCGVCPNHPGFIKHKEWRNHAASNEHQTHEQAGGLPDPLTGEQLRRVREKFRTEYRKTGSQE
jgi:hypothetical protein